MHHLLKSSVDSQRLAQWVRFHPQFPVAPVDDLYVLFRRPLAPLTPTSLGSFDSSVHISEEASNAATAVPWAIVYAIGIAGVLGWGTYLCVRRVIQSALTCLIAINVALAFCMGTDLDGILNDPIGQPMATIFFNSFGQKGTLAVWAIVVIVQ